MAAGSVIMPEAGQKMWTLRGEGEAPRTLRLPPGAVRTVGRGNRSDFVVADPLLSRVHCRLVASDAELVVEDLDSTNGTFVNEARVEARALADGDQLRIGRSRFAVSQERASGQSSQ